MPTVTSENRDEFIQNELDKKNPKSNFTYKNDFEKLSHPKLSEHYEKASKYGSSLTDKLIDEGYGNYTPNDLKGIPEPKPETVKSSLTHGEYMGKLHDEMRKRANESSKGYKYFFNFSR